MTDSKVEVKAGGVSLHKGVTLTPYSLDLSLQKLIMMTTSNRDFAMAHLNDDAAIAGGAPAAYADMISLMAFFEAALMSSLGPHAMLTAISGMRLSNFVIHGAPVLIVSEVTSVELGKPRTAKVELAMKLYQNNETPTTSAIVTATVPIED
jgi:hypothetical protein